MSRPPRVQPDLPAPLHVHYFFARPRLCPPPGTPPSPRPSFKLSPACPLQHPDQMLIAQPLALRFPSQDVVSSLRPQDAIFTLHSPSGGSPLLPLAMGMVAPFCTDSMGSQGPDRQDMLRVTGLVISEADLTSNVGVRNPGLTAYSDLGLPGQFQ